MGAKLGKGKVLGIYNNFNYFLCYCLHIYKVYIKFKIAENEDFVTKININVKVNKQKEYRNL